MFMRKRKASNNHRGNSELNIFGPSPVLQGEEESTYQELLAQITSALQPSDILERMWIREIADLSWEALRWRRLKGNLFSATLYQGVDRAIRPIMAGQKHQEFDRMDSFMVFQPSLAQRWAAKEEAAITEVGELLETGGLDMEAAHAHTLVYNLESIERIERLAASAEARRNAALRELQRYRRASGEVTRRPPMQIEGANASVVPDQEPA
jgi:hypothetical protein